MNMQEKAQWLANFYQKVADGGVMQARTENTPWVDQKVGPNIESFSQADWRIKPKTLDLIDQLRRITDQSDLDTFPATVHALADLNESLLGRVEHLEKTVQVLENRSFRGGEL